MSKEFSDIEAYSYVTLDMINTYSMLYKIEGTESSLKPYLMAAHFDVVSTDDQTDKWKYDPFSAQIEDGHIYARGCMDDKSSMMAHLESVRLFLKLNGQPKRTLYLAYGHDEELSGYQGGKQIAKFLSNVSLEYVLDEGPVVIEDVFPGLEKPAAWIGLTDKGKLNVKYFVNTTGGHSSMPNADESAVFVLGEAIGKLVTKIQHL